MSFKLMALAATAKTSTPTQKLILLLLADKANDDGICWPKMKTIAADACVTRQCVLENVKKLAALGFIHVKKRTVHDEELGHVRNASHIYMVNADKMREASGDRVNEVYSGGRVNEDYTLSKRCLHPKVNEDDNNNLSVEPINEPIMFGAGAPHDKEAFDLEDEKPSAVKKINPSAVSCAESIANSVLEINPKTKSLSSAKRDKTIRAWASDIEKINRLDGYDYDCIGKVLAFTLSDNFWKPNIMSGGKFRLQFEKLFARYKTSGPQKANYISVSASRNEEDYRL